MRRQSLQPAYRGPYLILERCRKFFVLDYGIHHDRVSIDRIKPVIFSMTSLNEESENACPHTTNLDKENIHSLSGLKCLMILMTLAREHHLKDKQNNIHYKTTYITIAQETNILPKGDLFMPQSALEITRWCNTQPKPLEVDLVLQKRKSVVYFEYR